ncbi:MAG: hypothetical protein GC162_14125 [Planctomycetes bacterium]|nr:hypothetical protein [Planctomycetota bacterium]
MNESPLPQTAELFESFFAAEMTEAQSHAFAGLLREEEELRRFYADYVQLHAHLRWELKARKYQTLRREARLSVGVRESSAARHADAEPAPGRSVWYTAAALVTLAAALLYVFLPTAPHSALPAPHSDTAVAMLSDLSPDAAFADASYALGSDLRAGEMALTRGKAQVMFHSGAVVDLTGPCELSMLGPNRGVLRSGTLNAYVPARAAGFMIQTPDGTRVIDLGTRFELSIDAPTADTLGVIEGRVQVVTTHESRVITAGQRVRVRDGRIEFAGPDEKWWQTYLAARLLNDAQAMAYYPLDGTASATLGPDGRIEGRVAPAADRFGRADGAMRFDGSGYIDIGATWPAGDYTVSAWVKPDAFKGDHMAYLVGVQNSGANPGRFLRLLEDGRPDAMVMCGRNGEPDTKTQVTAPAVQADQWVMITATFRALGPSAGELKLYVDGRRAETASTHGDPTHTDAMPNLKIGTRPDRPDAYRFRGLIDDVLILRSTLTDEQVAEMYRVSHPVTSPATPDDISVPSTPKEITQ